MNDISGFDSLVRTSRHDIVRYLGRLVGEADADDVAQIALSKAATALPTFRGESSLRSWLFRIATNAGRDWLRARTAQRQEPYADEDGPEELEAPADPSQERQLVREEMSACVREVLTRLPEGYQQVLALSECEDLTDREVADILGLTVASTKIRLHRARARLKKELEGACCFYRNSENVLCCDRKQKSTEEAYPSGDGARHQVGSAAKGGSPSNTTEDEPMTANESLPTKQKHLIGIGAAIAAGCQPCTSSFAAGARAAGACDRGIRLAIETGLSGRGSATKVMSDFADRAFAKPDIDATFRAERAQLLALIKVAAAVAANTASIVDSAVSAARELGATVDQIRTAAQIGRTAKRGAEAETDRTLAAALGDAPVAGCCAEGGEGARSSAEAKPSGCGCGSKEASPAKREAAPEGGCGCGATPDPGGFETVRLEKTSATCSLCEQYAAEHSTKAIVVMSCEGACLRGEISRQAANILCHELAPQKTVRLCLGGAFTKDGGQRALVRNAERVVALEGCPIRCASRMMRGHIPELRAEEIVTDALCEFDRKLFGLDALPTADVLKLGRTVAHKVAERL